ncbi:hypothetical protein HDU96_005054 [Phlyctochytrium bullatum]|nr:hypothetical protein HDU96_005054 [Phlyctochytrium bullatum]
MSQPTETELQPLRATDSQAELQGMDLTIWRSTTSDRLRSSPNEVDTEEATSPLMTCLRLFLSVFTIFSFALATSPVARKPGAPGSTDLDTNVPLDMTLNLTVVGNLHWSEPRTHLVLQPKTRSTQPGPEEPPVSVLAVPALFGPVIKTSFKAPLLVLDLDACDPFTIVLPEVAGINEPETTTTTSPSSASAPPTPKPAVETFNSTTVSPHNATHLQAEATAGINKTVHVLNRRGGPVAGDDASDTAFWFQPDTRRTKWFVMIPRGNCPFDVKIYHAQQAGFSGAIVYSSSPPAGGSFADLPVRMSQNALGDRISFTSAMFLTHHDANKLIRASAMSFVGGQSVPQPLLIRVSPDTWPAFGWGNAAKTGSSGELTQSLLGMAADLLFLSVTVFVLSVAFMSFYLAINMIRNYLVHGSMFVVIMHYSQPTPDSDSNGNASEEEEKLLEKITLPLRIVKAEDLAAEAADVEKAKEGEERTGLAAGGSRECCAICIDEFVVGSRVRQLPCKHQFHDSCIDPWLLKHNRLCPICKRDVLALPKANQLPEKACEAASSVQHHDTTSSSHLDISPSEQCQSQASSQDTPAQESSQSERDDAQAPGHPRPVSRWFFWRRYIGARHGLPEQEEAIDLERQETRQ